MTESAREGAGRDPQRIGPYRILERIGQGGMGVVYLAHRDGFPSRVALKVIKLGMDTREVLARFEVERHALSLMDHSHIARVLDAGVSDSGQPFFVMEHVPGLPLTEYCDRRRLPVKERLQLFLQVCEAVTHAHQKGVIHRDLTPRNILVKEENDRPVPKVIDFGLARAVDHTGVAQSVFTEQGQILGTPEYMSPEQAGVSPFDIDARTDVYSLGVILYELLVGELPLDRKELREAGLIEMHRRIRELDPSPPSVRMIQSGTSETRARDRSTTTNGLRKQVSQDLDWVTLKALEKDRRRRYPTVQSLADDLHRFLHDQPVQAAAPSVGYRLKKWIARHRVGVAAGTVMLLCLVGGLVASLLFWFEAERERETTRLDADADLAAELVRSAKEDLWPRNSTKLAAMRDWLQRARDLVERAPMHDRRKAQIRAEEATNGEAAQRRELAQKRSEKFGFDLLWLMADTGIAAMVDRLEMATTVRERSNGAATEARWQQAIREVGEDPRFRDRGVTLQKVEGLVPLGRDGKSGLQEFLVLDTGAEPERRDSQVVPSPEMGIVLVLLPPGEFMMGEDPGTKPARAGRRVRIDAFFLGKYEVTQGQWVLLSEERNPSQWREDALGLPGSEKLLLQRPVENISLVKAESVLGRVALMPCTEGQWEYACRATAGSTLPWGTDTSLMGEFANVVDLACKEYRPPGEEPLDWIGIDHATARDGYVATAPVGRLRANDFGLYDMFGNVDEWCRGDGVDEPWAVGRDGDGLVLANQRSRTASARGGSYRSTEGAVRCSDGREVGRSNIDYRIGVRAARPWRD